MDTAAGIILWIEDESIKGSYMSRDDIKLIAACYNELFIYYGTDLLPVITDRLNSELMVIIQHGESDAYYMLWWIFTHCTPVYFTLDVSLYLKSSFIAYLFGASGTNPLPPYNWCPHCDHIEFIKPQVEEELSFCDQQHFRCPECGTECITYGCDIPFDQNYRINNNNANIIFDMISNRVNTNGYASISYEQMKQLSRALSLCDIYYPEEDVDTILYCIEIDNKLEGRLDECKAWETDDPWL